MNKEIEKAAYKFAESQNDGNAFTAYYMGLRVWSYECPTIELVKE